MMVPATIRCLNCDGKGYVVELRLDGMRHPIVRKGCGGSGKQVVRSGDKTWRQ